MDEHAPIGPGHPLYQQMMVLTATVRTLRRAQGKLNPEDVAFGSPEWDTVGAEFMRDVYKAMGGDPHELDFTDP